MDRSSVKLQKAANLKANIKEAEVFLQQMKKSLEIDRGELGNDEKGGFVLITNDQI